VLHIGNHAVPALLQQQYPAHFEQVWAVGILAVIGGYVACLFTSFNTWICLVRKKWAKKMWARMTEVGLGHPRIQKLQHPLLFNRDRL
jgi:hypothetical protein